MKKFYTETVSTCHVCGDDVKGTYWEAPEGVYLETTCPKHGGASELIEKDARFFREAYEYRGYRGVRHLFLPVTYRCNIACKYCYSHSNYPHAFPADRSIDELAAIVRGQACRTVNLAGGEPTVREDLPELLRNLKAQPSVQVLCVVTNGQKTADSRYFETLIEHGLDFLSVSFHMPGHSLEGPVMKRAMASMDNARSLRLPVWMTATIDEIRQIDPVLGIIEKYRKILFNTTIRSVRPYGNVGPEGMVHVSDMVRYLGKENDYRFGNHPFNRHVKLFGRTTKLCYWVNDRRMVDPYDATYVIHNGAIVPFHKGMILDDIYFRACAERH